MGAFYGSVQIRTEDRDAVVRAAAAAAMQAGIRCLVGPVLHGWVGVYPQGSGQDQRIGESLAQALGGEVLHAVVHDDDVMAYWFWYEGQLADSYWSAPGYFNEADRPAQEQMTGDPQAFGPVIARRGDEMLRVLARRQQGITFEASRLQQFAEFLGIRNTVTSYELLKAGEREGIEGWEQFEEVPADAAAAELAVQRQRRIQIEWKKEQLRKECRLLADVVEERLMPRACAAGGGMLVAWEGYGRDEARVEFFRPPWGEAEPGEIETGGNVNSVAADRAGHRMAMGLGNRVVVWEAAGWRPIFEWVEGDWAVETALSADGKLLAYASRAGIYVHEIDSGKRLTGFSATGGCALAMHPGGEYLLSAGSAVWFARIRDTDPWRELYPGGQTALPPELAKAVRKEMSSVDVDGMQQKWRAAIESAVEKLASTNPDPAVTAPLIARMRQQMEKQLDQMRAKFANLKAGRLAPPRQGNESVLCAGFTQDGTKLWLGTGSGLRIYDWSAVQNTPANSAMPKPLFAHDPGSASAAASSPGLIYAAVEAPGHNALLFGGYAGKLCQMDLATGRVRELCTPPDGGAIMGLAIAPDESAIGIYSRPALGEPADEPDERAVWGIWSYPALLGQSTQ